MITVILPVHNSEKYLRECIESLLNQTLHDLEFICIDGGSTDASVSILENYALMDNRFRLLFDRNTSYGHKINLGIEQAKGKYIAILETDDFIENNTYEMLYTVAEEYEVDYISSNYYSFFDMNGSRYRQKTVKIMSEDLCNKIICKSENVKLIEKSGIAIWTGLYRKSFLIDHQIRLNESKGAAFQDAGFSFLISIMAKRSYHLKDAFYNYRIDNANSSVKNQSISRIIMDEYKFIHDELLNRGVTDNEIWYEFYVRKYRGYLWNLERLNSDNQVLFYDLLRQEYQEDRLSGYLNPEELPYDINTALNKIDDRIEMIDLLRSISKSPINYFQELMSFMKQRNPIVIFGGGKYASKLLNLIPDEIKHNIECICDNDEAKCGSVYLGYRVISPVDACQIDHSSFVIANRSYFDDMQKQLLRLGINNDNIMIFHDDQFIEKLPVSVSGR